MVWNIVCIAAGGAFGSVARYALTGAMHRLTGWNFPIGTLTVNVIGCYLIGLLATMFHGPTLVREEYRLALLVGVLGGFTTFSAFGWGTFLLWNEGQFASAMVNVVLSNALGLAAVWAGFATAR